MELGIRNSLDLSPPHIDFNNISFDCQTKVYVDYTSRLISVVNI